MKDERILEKALKLLPKVHETRVEVARTIELEKKNDEIEIKQAADYRERTLNKGDKLFLDFGNHEVGYLTLDFKTVGSHADAPVWLRLHFAEQPVELFEDAKNYHGWICSSWIEEEQIHVDVLPSVYKLPRRYAFRYLMIEVIDISSKFSLVINDAIITAVSSADDEKLVPFETNNKTFQKLDRVAVRTLHNCMQTVFEDGPKRDRRLWMGDLRIQALANYETYQMNDMVKACLYLFAALPMEDGKMGACLFLDPVPEVDDTEMFDYSLFFTDILYDYYVRTGDEEALKDLWPTALRQIDIALKQINAEGLVEDSDRLGWCFLDWNLELNKQAGAQGVLLYTIKNAIYLAKEYERLTAGQNLSAEQRLTAEYEKLKLAVNEKLWDAEKEVYVSGSERQISFASQTWLVLGGAIEGKPAATLLKKLWNMDRVVGMVTPYMYHNYVDALISVGEKQLALEKMTEYWGQMVDQGADTFFELFNPMNPKESPYGGTIVNSYCHAWSCGPTYFLRKYYR